MKSEVNPLHSRITYHWLKEHIALAHLQIGSFSYIGAMQDVTGEQTMIFLRWLLANSTCVGEQLYQLVLRGNARH